MTTVSDYLRDFAEDVKSIDASNQDDYEEQKEALIEEYIAKIKRAFLHLLS